MADALDMQFVAALKESSDRLSSLVDALQRNAMPRDSVMAQVEQLQYELHRACSPSAMPSKGWIGVDLDGTLARFDGYISEEHIGDPVPQMAERVRKWLADGEDVRIFTARLDGGIVALAMGNPEGTKYRDVNRIRGIIQDWTFKHFGVRLPVTNKKDFGMKEIWDDRAVRVLLNSGTPCCASGTCSGH